MSMYRQRQMTQRRTNVINLEIMHINNTKQIWRFLKANLKIQQTANERKDLTPSQRKDKDAIQTDAEETRDEEMFAQDEAGNCRQVVM